MIHNFYIKVKHFFIFGKASIFNGFSRITEILSKKVKKNPRLF